MKNKKKKKIYNFWESEAPANNSQHWLCIAALNKLKVMHFWVWKLFKHLRGLVLFSIKPVINNTKHGTFLFIVKIQYILCLHIEKL